MKNELKEILESVVSHNTFLNKSDLLNAIEKSYEVGLSENQEKYNQLKNAFEDLLELFKECDIPKNNLTDEWKKRAGIL